MKIRVYAIAGLMMVTSLFALHAKDDCNLDPAFQCKFDKMLSQKTTNNLDEGSSNLYYTQTRVDSAFDARLGTKTSDDITEGSDNKYSQWYENNTDIYYTDGYVGIGTSVPGEKLTVDGLILIRPASDVSHNSPAIVVQSDDDFNYDGKYLNQYAFGFHFFSGNTGSGPGNNAYISGYNGVNIFTGASDGAAPRIRVNQNGNIGIGLADPLHPLHLANGAFVSEGGTWTDASSIQFKQDVMKLELNQAKDALAGLNPVLFRYKAAPQEQYAGFIAEEVPELVAMQGRKGLSPMDIVAVLTKVVQDQQKEIEILKAKMEKLEAKNK